MKFAYVGVIVAVFIIGAAGIMFLRPQETADAQKLQVVTSFYPLYFIASEIGGDKAEVRSITPAGVEPHEYEPTPQDLVAIQRSDLLILNGAGFEAWGANVVSAIPSSKVLLAGEALATLEGNPHEHEHEHEHEEGHEHEHEEEHEEHVADPHVWLSPVLAGKMADEILQSFQKADADNASYYAGNAARLKESLAALDAEYTQGLAQCDKKDIITSHAAFGYLAAAYGLRQVPISGLSTEAEPSAKDLADIANFAKENDVKVIFFESLVSPKLSQTIAREVGAQTMALDPIEGIAGDKLAAGVNYLTQMRANLANLKVALECH